MSRPSENFVNEDFVRSRHHPELALVLEEVDRWILINAMRVLLCSLQPFRNVAGRIAVLSFIRGADLNDLLVTTHGAKPDSDHLVGLAADFKPLDMGADAFFEMVRRGHAAGATWDKLNLYTDAGTFHVSHRLVDAGPPRQRVYLDWIRAR